MNSFSSADTKSKQENVFVKVLIPSNSGGAVIGKGGQGIVKAQEETGATVKISKVGEYFPDTSERICMIFGAKEAINCMINYISTCISEKTDNKGFARIDRQKQTILVVPNSSAGLLIGREGETISNIKKESGAFIQVSPKSFNQVSGERCVMISGNDDQRAAASKMIIDKIIEDPKLCSFPNLVYGDESNTYSTYGNSMKMGSPNFDSSSFESPGYHYPGGGSNSGMRGGNQNYHYNKIPPHASPPQMIMSPSSPSSSFHQMDFMASNSVNGITRTIDVDPEFVGAIIGPKGSAIVELQEITNTSIKISKKPDSNNNKSLTNAADGNSNTAQSVSGGNSGRRTVSIYGFYQDVSRAYLLVCDKIKAEQARRNRESNGGGGGMGMMNNGAAASNNSSNNSGPAGNGGHHY